MSDKQHVVPQFYLRNFSASGKQLNVYNLKRNEAFLGASLKGQCYGRNIYGEGAGLEKVLMDMEGDFARVISEILKTKALPSNLPDHFHLVRFVASQLVRPMGSIDGLNAQMDLIAKHLVKATTDRFTDQDLSKVRVRITNPGDVLLAYLEKFSRGLLDLGMILVVPPETHEFVTSDHPLVLYNTYAEVLPKGQLGGNGIVSVGAQMFLPLSPSSLLFLYDGKIYRARTDAEVQSASERDIDAVNLLQTVFAKGNLYFLTDGKTELLGLSRKARPLRVQRKENLTVLKDTGEPVTGDERGQRSELLMSHSTTPNVNLRLDFLRLRKEAARVPIEKRCAFRPQPPDPDETEAERERKANLAAARLVGKHFIPTESTRRPLVDE